MAILEEIYRSTTNEIYCHLKDGLHRLLFPIIVVSSSTTSEIRVYNFEGLPAILFPQPPFCPYYYDLINVGDRCFRGNIVTLPIALQSSVESSYQDNGKMNILHFIDLLRDTQKLLVHRSTCFYKIVWGKSDILQLIQLINDENYEVCCCAIATLGTIGDPQAIPALTEILKTRHHRSSVRGLATISLGQIGDAVSVQSLVDTLEENDWEIRYLALIAISIIKDASVINQVIDVMINDKDKHVRGRAALTLGEIGDPRSVPKLVSALKDDYYGVRDNVASALGMIGDATAIPSLIEVIKSDPEYGVRAVAASALMNIGSSSSISALIEARNDESEYVRNRVKSLLEKV